MGSLVHQAMEIAFDREFLPSLGRLDPGDTQRVLKSATTYQQEPKAPGLNLKQLKERHGGRRLWSIRASQELRVLLVREGATSATCSPVRSRTSRRGTSAADLASWPGGGAGGGGRPGGVRGR